MAIEPQAESCSNSELQHITLGVSGAFQNSQMDVAAVLSLCQWDLEKMSPHDTANSPCYSLGSLTYPPTCTRVRTHAHTLSQALCVSQETSR